MRFHVLDVGEVAPRGREFAGEVFLLRDQWNDWFKYETQFQVLRIDQAGEPRALGSIKIGQAPWPRNSRSPEVPTLFERLPSNMFSLGQGDGYYDALSDLGVPVREEMLRALRDIAVDLTLFDKVVGYDVVSSSLMRDIPEWVVRDQLHRVAHGGRRLTKFDATYVRNYDVGGRPRRIEIELDVIPDVEPPTNVQVIIGRNGAGKTQLLRSMASALMSEEEEVISGGDFVDALGAKSTVFERMTYVSFSAFDAIPPFRDGNNEARGLSYNYVGLKKVSSNRILESSRPSDEARSGDGSFEEANNQRVLTKSSDELASDFTKYLQECFAGLARIDRWKSAMQTLESDPTFADLEVTTLADAETEEERTDYARELFLSLSSGHKIVLLVLTSLVALVEERSLVIIDEPEGHLHPPLLASFVRALSDLLVNRNGVAIVATHSPVVLQEVPRKCVHTLWRVGETVKASRPSLETFGENVGVLTTEVFGLETALAGFHRRLLDVVTNSVDADYDDIIAEFGGQLGGEARALLQAILASRARRV